MELSQANQPLESIEESSDSDKKLKIPQNMEGGSNLDEINQMEEAIRKKKSVDVSRLSVHQNTHQPDQIALERESFSQAPKKNNSSEKGLFLNEDRAKGRVGCQVFQRMIEALGGWCIASIVVIFTCSFMVFMVIFVLISVQWGERFRDGEDTSSIVNLMLILSLISAVIASIRAMIYLSKGARVSRTVHSKMVFQILHCSITNYLERVPFGQLLNRFTSDIDLIDKRIFRLLGYVSIRFLLVIVDVAAVVTGGSNVLLIIPCFIFFVVGWWYRGRYMAVKREIVRLYSITKSPISGWGESVVKGSTVLRSIKKFDYCMKKMNFFIEENTKNGLISAALDSWFTIRLSIWSWILVLVPSYLYVIYQFKSGGTEADEVNYALLILFISGTTKLALDYQDFINDYSEFENSLIAIERCKRFEDIKAEPNYLSLEEDRENYENPKDTVNFDKSDIDKWGGKVLFPQGKIVVKGVTARYPSRSKAVLSDVSVEIEAGKKVGIVGRTGAGKSSFIKLFSRVLVPEKGVVMIDDQDISGLGIKLLRDQIGFITQKTSLFEGTLLENIDPYLEDKVKIKQIEGWLTEMGLDNNAEFKKGGLTMELSADGGNLSQSERQIVSFIRTIHKKRTVIIFDEATSNVDLKTEKLFQKKIDEHFQGSTMLVIAHRLQTVMQCDKILVFDDGKIVEYDSPGNLRANKNSHFSKLCQRM